MNKWLEDFIATVSPRWAVERQRYFAVYEGANNATRHRDSLKLDYGNADYSAGIAAKTLAEKARWIDANSDYGTGAIDNFVASVVGTSVITEPLLKRKDGSPFTELNEQIKELWQEFMKKPDIAGVCSGMEIQSLACRSWFRDGECFMRFYEGTGYRHETRLPLSVQLLESEQLPIEYNRHDLNIIQGIQKDEYGKPVIFWFYRNHPGDFSATQREMIPVTAQDVLHLKLIKRIGQTRGVSALHAVTHRIQDIAEIDTYETAAVKMGAAIGLKIERSAEYEANSQNRRQEIQRFYPGMVLDGLDVGETAEMLNPNGRPNPEVIAFRDDVLRAVAAGMGVSASTLMRKYQSSYSAERQALVETQKLIDTRIKLFIDKFVQPLYERFLQVSIIYGQVKIPAKLILPTTLFRASHKAPVMPWIDPLKEVNAKIQTIQAGLDSRTNQIRATGRNPDDVYQEIIVETQRDKDHEISFTTSADGNPTGVNPETPAPATDKTSTDNNDA
jgi:lambda family phage portal protein